METCDVTYNPAYRENSFSPIDVAIYVFIKIVEVMNIQPPHKQIIGIKKSTENNCHA